MFGISKVSLSILFYALSLESVNAQTTAVQTTGTVGGDGDRSSEGVLTSRGVDGDLYRAAAGGLAFNVTTVFMESEFNEVNAENEVHLVYDYYAPSDTVNTSYDLRLYDADCVTHGGDSNVGSEFITVSTADVLYLRNAAMDSGAVSKTDAAQVHLAGQGWSGQTRLDIPLDIHQDEIFRSTYFQYEDDSHYTIAHIAFCARFVMFYDIDNDGDFRIHRFDPYLEVEAVQFHETLVQLTFNLTQDFQVSDISLQKDAIINRSDTQRLKYQLAVYHCEPKSEDIALADSSTVDTPYGGTYPANYAIHNDSYHEVGGSTGIVRTITQSTIVYICMHLEGGSANIGIREIAMLEFIQPASQITSFAIYERTPNAITTESHYGSEKRKRLVVSTRLVLPFFDNRNPADAWADGADAAAIAAAKESTTYDSQSFSNVIAKGTAIMMFQNDGDALRHLLGVNRDLQEAGEEAEEDFEVQLGLGYDDDSASPEIMKFLAIIIGGASVLAII